MGLDLDLLLSLSLLPLAFFLFGFAVGQFYTTRRINRQYNALMEDFLRRVKQNTPEGPAR